MRPVLYIVVPCYNEEEVLPITSVQFAEKLDELIKAKKIAARSRVLFVNDGSKDDSIRLSEEYLKDKVYDTVIPRNVRLAEAPSHGVPILEYDSRSSGANAYRRLADEVIQFG